MDFQKTIIIIGASSEIGSKISLKLASQGYNLILTYNESEEKIINLKNNILENFKINLSVIKLNLLEEEYNSLEESLEGISEESLKGMVFCSGFTPQRKAFFHLSLNEVKEVFMINVISAYQIAAIVGNKMKLNKSLENGSFVFISSQIANYGSEGISAYAASKGGLNSLGISLAKELGPSNIRVNIVSPGPVNTNKIKSEVLQNISGLTPLKRICSTNDVANLVSFLFSKESYFINGANIPINGGR